MGDRTFSAEDVIRIYEEYLTESEMETVDEFFEAPPGEEGLQTIRSVLALFESIQVTLVFVSTLVQISAVARTALRVTIALLAGAIRILEGIIQRAEANA